MQLVILGKSPAWQNPGGACSGYLVEHGGQRILLDCGSGVFSKLREHCSPNAVQTIVISHMHPDHFFDLVPYAYGLTQHTSEVGQPITSHSGGPESDAPHPDLYLPPGGRKIVSDLFGLVEAPNQIEASFTVREYDPAAGLTVDDLRITFLSVPHYIDAYAIDVRSIAEGKRITYGGDHSPSDNLGDFANQTDLLLVEATLFEPEQSERGHLTAAEAGQQAQAANAKRAILTHIAVENDPDRALGQARQFFDGPLEIAQEGRTYPI